MSFLDLSDDAAATPILPAGLRLGAVHLTVTDLDATAAWYQRVLGLRVTALDVDRAELGDGDVTVLVLHEDPQAKPAGDSANLYHFALLYPTREELARAAVRLAIGRTPVEGLSDHHTHEAIYLRDLEGNGIELAWDRARDLWPSTQVPPTPLDTDSLLATVADEQPSDFVGAGLRVGHLHLHVGDVARALAWYRDVLGFELHGNWGTAAFVSAGGYHHHLAFNVWGGPGWSGQPPRSAGLRHWTVELPDAAAIDAVRGRIEEAGHAVSPTDAGFEVDDPWSATMAVVVAGAQS